MHAPRIIHPPISPSSLRIIWTTNPKVRIYDIPEFRRFSGGPHVWFLFRIWLSVELSMLGCWNSFRWEIWSGEGTEESKPPLMEESGPWMFPGLPIRSTTYSLLWNLCGHKTKMTKDWERCTIEKIWIKAYDSIIWWSKHTKIVNSITLIKRYVRQCNNFKEKLYGYPRNNFSRILMGKTGEAKP